MNRTWIEIISASEKVDITICYSPWKQQELTENNLVKKIYKYITCLISLYLTKPSKWLSYRITFPHTAFKHVENSIKRIIFFNENETLTYNPQWMCVCSHIIHGYSCTFRRFSVLNFFHKKIKTVLFLVFRSHDYKTN